MLLPSSSLSNHFKYDVFLSFRGEETRTTFVDHLFAALAQKGITTFKNDDDKEKCKEIEESRFAIVIFSKSYASSSWCLDELVHIIKCSKNNGQLVLPVYYYDFDPSYLRRQGPVFGEFFAKYEMEKARAWASALVEAANLNGLGLIDYRYQGTRIKEIVETVLSKLNISKVNNNNNKIAMEKKHDILGDTTSSHEQLVGIDRRVQQVKELLKVETVKTASNPASPLPSPRSSRWTYDVFMSFKANDTCKDFADKLHSALKQHNIYAFRNDQALARVESIDSEHLKVIEESHIAVVVFSENYSASSCCLDELVKIMNCNEHMGQMVFPIFYDVDSSDVRYQTGLFGEAFMRNKPEKVEIWKKTLAKACSLAGWYLNGTSKSDEASVIKGIVDVISRRLDWLPVSVDDNLIGIEAHMKHVMSLLKLEAGSIHMLGICGMGGIGKTTIAKAVFGQVSTCFDGSCFVENIGEVSKSRGLKHIPREMLSSLLKDEELDVSINSVDHLKQCLVQRKVLLVLDDVDEISQLETLVGSGKWFGEGSRIIVTTRDERLLVTHNIMQTYYVKPLDDNETYQFLIRHAFKKDDCTKAYEDLFPQVVSYAGGLPLALKVLSSLLCGRSKKEWTSTLARLQVFPEKVIQDTLKKSYDSLDAAEKQVFLDIACFFNDTKKDYAVNVLNSCGFSGEKCLQSLEQKSLLSISKGEIKMHKLIAQMGRDSAMHPDKPWKRSRLWHAEEVYDILIDNMGAKEIKAIAVDDMSDYDAVDVTKAFIGMKKLRLLQIRSHNKLRFHEGSGYLPRSLRWLTWDNYPQPSLPKSFQGNELVGLELRGSSISEPWSGIEPLWSLCFLDLSYSVKLVKTHDFTGTPNLKELKLEYCVSLIDVHESIGYLDRLSLVSFRSCTTLETLPHSFWKLKSVTRLDVAGCINLKVPKFMEHQLPFPSDSRMIKVPDSIGILSNLVELDLSYLSLPSLHSNVNLSLPSLHSNVNLSLPTLHSLKLGETLHLHDTPINIGQHSSSPEPKTSQEMVEYKKQIIFLLPWKDV